MYNILICDDERDIVNALKIYLSDPEYRILEAYNGQDAVQIVKSENIHLVLLDIMMPVLDGITAMSEIRKTSNVPIILLSAKSEDCDKILGLNLGADDYITKPFNPVEVTARVNSQIRRYVRFGGNVSNQNVISCGGIELDDEQKKVTCDGNEVCLTPLEYEILKLLMQSPGKVFSPKEIYKTVWGGVYDGCDNTVAVHIRHIREKTEIDPAEPRYIKVVWGQGYKFEKEKAK